MIRIPLAENRVGLAAATDAKFQAADFSGTGLQALGHGLDQLGQAGQQFAKARQEQQDRVQSLHDDGVMKYSYRTLADRSRDLLHAGPDALLNRVGAAAGDGQRTFVEQILPLRKQLLDQIDDRGLADLTAGTLDARIRQDLDRVQAHAEAQTAVWQRQQSEGLQDSAAADALHAVGTPLFVDHAATGLRAIETQADIDNEPPEVRRAKEAGYISGIHARVIDDQMMRDPVGAQAYAGIHHREIGDADRAAVDRALHPALVEREGAAVVDGCVAATTGATPQVGPIPAGPVDIADRMTAITLHRDAPSRGATSPALAQDGAGQGDPTGRATAPALAASPDPTASPDPAGGRSLVAMMDRYGGDPVKAWAAYRAGPDTVDAALAGHGDGWFAALPAEARSYVHTNVAMLGGTGDHTPERADLPSLRASIAAQDLPDEVKRAALANADLRVARGERATRQRQDAATDAAYAAADDLGVGFTSITQLPPAIQRDLPPATIEALTRQAGQHAVPQPVAENGDAVAGLNLQLSRDPAAFAQQDLRLVRDLMTPREYATLSALQSQLRTNPAAPPVVAQRRILATIARDGPTLGIDLANPDPAMRQRAQTLAAAMATDLAAETAGKRLPTDEEIARSFQRQSHMVTPQLDSNRREERPFIDYEGGPDAGLRARPVLVAEPHYISGPGGAFGYYQLVGDKAVFINVGEEAANTETNKLMFASLGAPALAAAGATAVPAVAGYAGSFYLGSGASAIASGGAGFVMGGTFGASMEFAKNRVMNFPDTAGGYTSAILGGGIGATGIKLLPNALLGTPIGARAQSMTLGAFSGFAGDVTGQLVDNGGNVSQWSGRDLILSTVLGGGLGGMTSFEFRSPLVGTAGRNSSVSVYQGLRTRMADGNITRTKVRYPIKAGAANAVTGSGQQAIGTVIDGARRKPNKK